MAALLLKGGAQVDSRDAEGRTPLMVAAGKGNSEVVAVLLERGATTRAVDDIDGETPLHLAADSGSEEVVEMLLAAGADINVASTSNGGAPLFFAAYFGHADLIEFMLAHGADLEKKLTGMGRRMSIDQLLDHAVAEGWVVVNGSRIIAGATDPELPASADRFVPVPEFGENAGSPRTRIHDSRAGLVHLVRAALIKRCVSAERRAPGLVMLPGLSRKNQALSPIRP